MTVVDQTKEKMKAALEHFKEDLKSIRTGHANPAMLEKVSVEVYGTQMRLRDIASVATPEPRQLLISPYDPHNVDAIRKGIEKANIGFQPIVDGHAVRINIPPMDKEMREGMIKLCHEKAEKAKVGMRSVRRDANEATRKMKAELGEDLMHKYEEDIQKLTDDFCKEIDHITQEKGKEVSTI